MVFLSILSLIVAKALPLFNKELPPIYFLRISAIVLVYAGVLSFNTFYIQSIGSGIGIYSGLFQVTVIFQMIDAVFTGSFVNLSFPLPISNQQSNEIPPLNPEEAANSIDRLLEMRDEIALSYAERGIFVKPGDLLFNKKGWEKIQEDRYLEKWEQMKKSIENIENAQVAPELQNPLPKMFGSYYKNHFTNANSFQEFYQNINNSPLNEEPGKKLVNLVNPLYESFLKDLRRDNPTFNNLEVSPQLFIWENSKLIINFKDLDVVLDFFLKYAVKNKYELMLAVSELGITSLGVFFIYKNLRIVQKETLNSEFKDKLKEISGKTLSAEQIDQIMKYRYHEITKFSAGRAVFFTLVIYSILQLVKTSHTIKLPDIKINIQDKNFNKTETSSHTSALASSGSPNSNSKLSDKTVESVPITTSSTTPPVAPEEEGIVLKKNFLPFIVTLKFKKVKIPKFFNYLFLLLVLILTYKYVDYIYVKYITLIFYGLNIVNQIYSLRVILEFSDLKPKPKPKPNSQEEEKYNAEVNEKKMRIMNTKIPRYLPSFLKKLLFNYYNELHKISRVEPLILIVNFKIITAFYSCIMFIFLFLTLSLFQLYL